MVSQTSVVLKAFGDAPENSRFTYSIRSSTLKDFWLKFTVKTSYICPLVAYMNKYIMQDSRF